MKIAQFRDKQTRETPESHETDNGYILNTPQNTIRSTNYPDTRFP